MLIALGVIVYIMACIVQSALVDIYGKTPYKILFCLLSIPMIPAIFVLKDNTRLTKWKFATSALLYVIALILFLI